jgi:murein DD-endopeptidase MepM/ murein hydrolase activator NlpD
MFWKKGKIYRADGQLQLHEIRWFRVKAAVSFAGSTAMVVLALLVVNYYVYDFLGMGYTTIQSLKDENKVLHQQLATLTEHMKTLEGTMAKIDREGNRLRLLVDLPPVDDETRAAGTGGAAMSADIAPANLNVQVMQNASSTLEKLSSEIRVQQQSYDQIIRKYEYNKAFFAALPALKPMEGYYATREFGPRMHPVLGIFKTHTGLDIVNDVGTPVVAAADGVIEMAGQSGGGYGTVVVIRHGYGYQTLYAHLSKTLVREGQHVRRGDLIAKSGKTGLVSGPHLHYEVRRNGVAQNPVNFFFDDVKPYDYRRQVASR